MTDQPTRPTSDPDARPDERQGRPDPRPDGGEDVDPLLKEGAGAPDAADIEDPERQL